MFDPYLIDFFIGFACLAVATCYGLLSIVALLAWRIARAQRVTPTTNFEGVTILKPLCGDEPGLYEDLRSFCFQDYPDYQIVFGLQDHSDPARAVAERLKREFQSLSIEIVVEGRMHGSNAKVSNLMNMLPYAEYDLLAIVDSDASVGPDYLKCVIAPFREEGVGLVTCLYRSLPTAGVWSHLGAMYVNDWYMPAVILAWFFGHRSYVSGQTICVRQRTLRAFGGLSSVAHHLAEDYLLGECVRGLGLRIVLSRYVVTGESHEPSLGALIRHEVRWMRTLRALRSRSFCWLFLTFSLPLASLGLVLASMNGSDVLLARGLFSICVVCRIAFHVANRAKGGGSLLRDIWLLPVRDLLLACVWLTSFLASRITWRGQDYNVGRDGFLRKVG